MRAPEMSDHTGCLVVLLLLGLFFIVGATAGDVATLLGRVGWVTLGLLLAAPFIGSLVDHHRRRAIVRRAEKALEADPGVFGGELERLSKMQFGSRVLVTPRGLRFAWPYALRLLSAFSYDHRTLIDLADRVIRLEDKRWWRWQPPRAIPFDQVRYVDTEYYAKSSGHSSRKIKYSDAHVHQSQESGNLYVSVAGEKASEKAIVAVFRTHSMHKLYSTDRRGEQTLGEKAGGTTAEDAFAEALVRILDVPLGRPADLDAAGTAVRYECERCGRPAGPNQQRCRYCPGSIVAVGGDAAASAPAPKPGAVAEGLCPSCGRRLPTRRRDHCLYCGAPLEGEAVEGG